MSPPFLPEFLQPYVLDNIKSLSDINDIKVEVEDYSPNTKEIQTTNNVEENLITHSNQSSLGGRNLMKPEGTVLKIYL